MLDDLLIKQIMSLIKDHPPFGFTKDLNRVSFGAALMEMEGFDLLLEHELHDICLLWFCYYIDFFEENGGTFYNMIWYQLEAFLKGNKNKF